jgi:RHS repeat-associated protein
MARFVFNLLQPLTTNDLLSSFGYDNNGNQITANTERHYEYDAGDMMRVYYNQTSTGVEPSVYAHYVYSGGSRVKKLVRTASNEYETVIYLGPFEYRKKVTASTTEEKNYTQVIGGIEIRTGSFTGDITDTVTYSLGDHLGSVSTRVNSGRTIIDTEEYYPYGDSSMRTTDKKRYRYTGKEKDAESKLYYYGARYYTAWACTFNSVDPAAGSTHYQSSYNYADCNPVMMNDPTGMQSEGQGGGGGDGGGAGTDAPSLMTYPDHKGNNISIPTDSQVNVATDGSVTGTLGQSGVTVTVPKGTLVSFSVNNVNYKGMYELGNSDRFLGYANENGDYYIPPGSPDGAPNGGEGETSALTAASDTSTAEASCDAPAPVAPAPPAAQSSGADSAPVEEKGIGQPSELGSMVPVYGSTRSAIDDFQNGRYFWGTVNAISAISDLTGFGALAKIGVKAIIKGGIFAYGRRELSENTAKRVTEAVNHNLINNPELLWKVGDYDNLKKLAKNTDLDAHHAGQKELMTIFVSGYNGKTGPSILVPKIGHTVGTGVLNRGTKIPTTAREVLARDIFELRRVYIGHIPNSALQKLITLNKKMYPQAF